MPQSFSTPVPPHPRRHARLLVCLTAVVVLGHWTLLLAAPLSASPSTGMVSSSTAAFITRTVQAQAAPKPLSPAPTAARAAKAQAPKAAPTARTDTTSAAAPAAVQLAAADATPAVIVAPPVAAPPIAAPTPPVSAAAPKTSGSGPLVASPPKFAIAAPARMQYEVKGVAGGTSYTGAGELSWQHDGKSYEARLAVSKFLIPLRVQTSKGQLSPQGLEPTRFGDKRGSEVAAHFERQLGKIIFSANTPDTPLQPGAQDHLSVFLQLGALLSAEPGRYPAGSTLAFQAVGSHYAEQWAFVLGSLEKQTLPGGDITAIKLTRDPLHERDSKVEAWLAPDAGYLPVHIRLSQANGDYVDMLWSSTQKP